MSSLIVSGQDIEPFMPKGFSDSQKEQLHTLTESVAEAVLGQMPIGYSYNHNVRLVLPHSVFLQEKTPSTISEVKKPGHIKTRMRFYSRGARKAIGMDVFQHTSLQRETSKNGWKTFHLDQIDDLRLLTAEEIKKTLNIQDEVEENIHLTEGFVTVGDFVRNWNHWFRTFLTQTKAQYDLKK